MLIHIMNSGSTALLMFNREAPKIASGIGQVAEVTSCKI
jgi:hypothetical protein